VLALVSVSIDEAVRPPRDLQIALAAITLLGFVVFVFGSERAGLSASFVARADEVIGIPMYGVNHSFPVAVAAGIVMHEWARRRYREGRRAEP